MFHGKNGLKSSITNPTYFRKLRSCLRRLKMPRIAFQIMSKPYHDLTPKHLSSGQILFTARCADERESIGTEITGTYSFSGLCVINLRHISGHIKSLHWSKCYATAFDGLEIYASKSKNFRFRINLTFDLP